MPAHHHLAAFRRDLDRFEATAQHHEHGVRYGTLSEDGLAFWDAPHPRLTGNIVAGLGIEPSEERELPDRCAVQKPSRHSGPFGLRSGRLPRLSVHFPSQLHMIWPTAGVARERVRTLRLRNNIASPPTYLAGR